MPEKTVYISIGSNIEPARHIPDAIHLLRKHPDIADFQTSSFYTNRALGRPDQPHYRNGVARFTTRLSLEQLKSDILRDIEHRCGRERSEDRYAPRTLDLDIILFGDEIISTDAMTIPDPAIWQRSFVTIPLLEIAPNLAIPGRDGTLSELAASIDLEVLPKDEALNTLVQEGMNHG